ncbi:hypothetical protein AOA80_07190 [Methanomassiliicoccales archaeon RumEn M1]|nr:hypothetical protein AOA80_07190 [Methanomassiliicoccales archaeon RumEn M1]
MLFEKIANGVNRHYKKIIVIWVIALLLAVPAMLQIGSVMDYQMDLGSGDDQESVRAQRIISDNFQRSVANGTILVVLQADDVTSPAMREYVLALQGRILSSPDVTDLEGAASLYTFSEEIMTQAVLQLGPELYSVEQQVNQTAFMLWGIPAMHENIWTQSGGDDAAAYMGTSAQLSEMFQDSDPAMAMLAFGYYDAFAAAWNDSIGLAADPMARASAAVTTGGAGFINTSVPVPEQRQFMLNVLGGFNLTTFNVDAMHHGFALGMVSTVSGIDQAFLQQVYDLGPDYRESDVRGFAQEIVSGNAPSALPIEVPEQLLSNFVSDDGRTMLLMFNFDVSATFVDDDGRYPLLENVKVIREEIEALNEELTAPSAIYVTGEAAISEDMRASSEADMAMIEPVTIIIIFVLMGVLFRSVLAQFLPLGAVGVAVGISQALMFAVGVLVAPVNVMVTTMLFSILMAVGTDYAIFIVSRYREERMRGKTRQEAVHASVTWAGESVATSGATVIIAFFAMTISSFPMVQIMGLVLGLGIVVALLVALTLVPSVLLVVGNRVFWPNSGKRWDRYAARTMKAKSEAKHGYFHRAAKFSVKHAKVILLASILVSVPSTYLFLTAETSFDFIGSMGNTESIEGMNAMTEDFGAGRIMPTQIVVTGDTEVYDGTNFNIQYLHAIDNLTAEIAASDMVRSVSSITRPYGVWVDYTALGQMSDEARAQVVSNMLESLGSDGKSVLLTVVLKEQPMSVDSVNFIPELREHIAEVHATLPELASSEILVGGSTATNYDLSLSTNQQFRMIELTVIVGIFIVLLVVLGSLLLPAFAVVSIAMSITWSFALTWLVFEAWLGIPILWMVPLILFVILMGIGMDYNVFILTRIREEVHKGKEIKQAVVDAVDWTGGIITALALIMAGAFGTIMLSSNAMLQQFGFALLTAVLFDAMVVRTYIVPAAVTVMGKWAWWAPGRLKRTMHKDENIEQ